MIEFVINILSSKKQSLEPPKSASLLINILCIYMVNKISVAQNLGYYNQGDPKLYCRRHRPFNLLNSLQSLEGVNCIHKSKIEKDFQLLFNIIRRNRIKWLLGRNTYQSKLIPITFVYFWLVHFLLIIQKALNLFRNNNVAAMLTVNKQFHFVQVTRCNHIWPSRILLSAPNH